MLLILLLLHQLVVSSAEVSIVWQRLAEQWSCIPDQLALYPRWTNLRSDMDCVVVASARVSIETGVAIVQYQPDDKFCRVFLYAAACSPAQQTGFNAVKACVTYLLAPVELLAFSAKLQGAWVASQRTGRFENLMCLTDRTKVAQWKPFNIEWSADGAVFDGFKAHMRLETSSVSPLSLQAPFTWLVRVKRQSLTQLQPILEIVRPTDNRVFAHLWEYNETSRLQFVVNLANPYKSIRTVSGALPSSASNETWVDIAAVAESNSLRLIVNGLQADLAIDNPVASVLPETPTANLWLFLGHRWFIGSNDSFRGCIRAFGHANAALNASEMKQQFFDLLP